MRYVVDEEDWRRKCHAAGVAGNAVPDNLTDKLIDKILRAHLTERLEFTDRKIEGLYLRAEADYTQKDDTTAPGARTWRLRARVRATGERLHYRLGDARKGMTLEDARAKAVRDLAKIQDGHDPVAVAEAEAGRMQTVGHYLESTYARQVLAPLRTGKEIHEYMRKVWAPVLAKPLCALTRDDLEGALTTWKVRPGVRGRKELAGGTVRKVWQQFCAMLRHADQGEVIPADLTRRLLREPGALHRAKAGEHVRWLGQLDPDEPRKLREALAAFTTREPGGGHFLQACVRIALATGMRAGEIVGLTDAAVNLREKTIFLRADGTKGNKDHRISLNDAAVAALGEWLKARNAFCIGHGGRLFPHLPGLPAGHWSHRLKNANRDWNVMRRAAGIEGRCACCNRHLTVHDLRHTFSVKFLQAGGTMAELQKALGHSDITTTQRHYGHVLETDVRRVVLAMPDVLAM